MNSDGSGVSRLTDNAMQEDPAWSPDGRRIAFPSTRPIQGGLDIFVIDADGTDMTPVTANSKNGYHPTWQPLCS